MRCRFRCCRSLRCLYQVRPTSPALVLQVYSCSRGAELVRQLKVLTSYSYSRSSELVRQLKVLTNSSCSRSAEFVHQLKVLTDYSCSSNATLGMPAALLHSCAYREAWWNLSTLLPCLLSSTLFSFDGWCWLRWCVFVISVEIRLALLRRTDAGLSLSFSPSLHRCSLSCWRCLEHSYSPSARSCHSTVNVFIRTKCSSSEIF